MVRGNADACEARDNSQPLARAHVYVDEHREPPKRPRSCSSGRWSRLRSTWRKLNTSARSFERVRLHNTSVRAREKERERGRNRRARSGLEKICSSLIGAERRDTNGRGQRGPGRSSSGESTIGVCLSYVGYADAFKFRLKSRYERIRRALSYQCPPSTPGEDHSGKSRSDAKCAPVTFE